MTTEKKSAITTCGGKVLVGVIGAAIAALCIAVNINTSAQNLMNEIVPGITVYGERSSPLDGVMIYDTSEGTLLGNLSQGIVIRGTLEDLRTGDNLLAGRSRPLPFNSDRGSEQQMASHASEDREQDIDLTKTDSTLARDPLKGALEQRLAALRAEELTTTEPAAPVIEAPVIQVPVSEPTLTITDVDNNLPPEGAIPRIGFDNSGRPVPAAAAKLQAQSLMSKLPPEWMVVYPAENAVHTITVMTDPTCPYCRKLHTSIGDLNAAGITVRYLFYPRALGAGADNPEAITLLNRINKAWCSEDPKAAMNSLFSGGSPGRACSELTEDDKRPRDPAADHYVIGQILGVDGTPYIVDETGSKWAGFSDVASLVAQIESSGP